jgi:hypothetical protein
MRRPPTDAGGSTIRGVSTTPREAWVLDIPPTLAKTRTPPAEIQVSTGDRRTLLQRPTLIWNDHNMMQGRCDTFVTRRAEHPPRVDLMLALARRHSGRSPSEARARPKRMGLAAMTLPERVVSRPALGSSL